MAAVAYRPWNSGTATILGIDIAPGRNATSRAFLSPSLATTAGAACALGYVGATHRILLASTRSSSPLAALAAAMSAS